MSALDFWDNLPAFACLPETERLRLLKQLAEALPKKLNASSADQENARFRDAQALLLLTACLKTDPALAIVHECLNILGRLQAVSAIEALLIVATGKAAVFSSDQKGASEEALLRLRIQAVQSLGKIGDEAIVTPLMRLLNNRHENYRLRLAVADTLGKLGNNKATVPLLDILADEREKSTYLKESAAKALGLLGDIRALGPLIDLLESKSGFREKMQFLKEQVIQAIGRISRHGDPARATEAILKALDDEASSIRLAAVEALAMIEDSRCLPALMARVSDPDDNVAIAAIEAVYTLGGQPALLQLMADDNLPRFLREELSRYLAHEDNAQERDTQEEDG